MSGWEEREPTLLSSVGLPAGDVTGEARKAIIKPPSIGHTLTGDEQEPTLLGEVTVWPLGRFKERPPDWQAQLQELLMRIAVVEGKITQGIVGPQGPQGVPGFSASIRVGQTITSAVGSSAEVTNVGSPVTAVLDFVIPRGAQGPQGEAGTGVTILGSFDSEEELRTSHPTGEPGQSYLVAGDLFVWSASEHKWVNVGNIRGPQGERGDVGERGPQGEQGVFDPSGDWNVTGSLTLKGEEIVTEAPATGKDYARNGQARDWQTISTDGGDY